MANSTIYLIHKYICCELYKNENGYIQITQTEANKHTSLYPTSGRTGSSIPTTVMQVNSVTISVSLSHSGSGLDGRSRYAMHMVLNPSHAMGSITY